VKPSFPKFQLALVLILAAVSAGAIAVTHWTLKPAFYFEVSMRSPTAGTVQTFYDIGRGINEHDSVRLPVRGGESNVIYRFRLSAGEYRTIRFDPLDHGNADLVINYARIVDKFGQTLRRFSLGELRVANGISASEIKDGRMFLTLGPADNDSNLIINPGTPLALHMAPSARLLFAGRTFLLYFLPLGALGTLWLIFAGRLWSQRMQQRWLQLATWVRRHPCRALLIVATISTVVSCYPVVFFGKSFVSPNNGVLLLYDRLPTLPGYTSSTQDDAKGADLGAAAWFHLPCAVVESRALLHDFELPLWNRYDSCGIALLGQGQSMLGDPLHTIVLIAGGATWAWDFKFILAKILFAWGMGLTVLIAARHLPSAVILTASSVFIGFFVFRYDHAAIFSLCYSPWILYCWFRIREAPDIRRTAPWIVGLMAACWAEMNSGTVKEAYMLLLGMNGCGLLVFALAEGPTSLRLRKLVHLAIGGSLFAAISAPIWLIFLDTLHTAYTGYKIPGAWQIQPSLLIGIFDDMFYREFMPREGALAPSTNFLVLLGVMLAIGHFRILITDSVFRAIGISALLPFGLVFGIVPPSVITRVPFVRNVIHIDNTFSCVLIVHLIVLGGFGLRAFWQRWDSNEWKINTVVAFAFLALLLSLYLGFAQASDAGQSALLHSHNIVTSRFFDCYILSLLVAVIALPFITRFVLRAPSKGFLLAPVFFLCLLLLHWRYGMYIKSPFDEYVMNPQVRVNLAANSPAIQLIRANQQAPSRAVGLGDNLFAGFNAALGIEGINGADALINPYFRQLTEAWGIEKQWDWRFIIRNDNLTLVKALCDLLNVRYYLGPSSQQSVAGLESVSDLDLTIHESKSVWPRAFFTDRLSSYNTVSELVGMIKAGDGRPFAAVARTDFSQDVSLSQIAEGRPTNDQVVAADNYRLTNNVTSFKVTAPKAGVIVLTEAYLPGDFEVDVNGKSAPYFRVNHAFKGVAVDKPGIYAITFSYRPRHFVLSLWISLFGTIALCFYIWQTRTKWSQ